MKTKKILAIDYGTKRVGLARAEHGFAEPWQVLHQHDFSDETTLLEHVAELCQQENFELVVVGISENTMAEKTWDFISRLKTHIEIPIETADETLSSQNAIAKMRQRGAPQKGPIDHFAAAYFLQEWIDTRPDL